MSKAKKKPKKKQLDNRVFSEFSLVIYDPLTLGVKEVMPNVPKGVDLVTLQDRTQGFSFGFYKGKTPLNYHRYKFVNGKLLAKAQPIFFMEAETPFYVKDAMGYMVPVIIRGSEVRITAKSLTNNGRVYTHKTRRPLRFEASGGEISHSYLPKYTGSSSIILTTKDMTAKKALIKCTSKHFGVISLPLMITSGIINDARN
jgi:hypothetical protein